MVAKTVKPAVKSYDPDDDVALSGVTPSSLTFNVRNPFGYNINSQIVESMVFQPVFTGYTSVTVKAQATLDDTTWADITSATTATSGDIVKFDIRAFSQVRLHVTGTLTGGIDTMEIWTQFLINE